MPYLAIYFSLVKNSYNGEVWFSSCDNVALYYFKHGRPCSLKVFTLFFYFWPVSQEQNITQNALSRFTFSRVHILVFLHDVPNAYYFCMTRLNMLFLTTQGLFLVTLWLYYLYFQQVNAGMTSKSESIAVFVWGF